MGGAPTEVNAKLCSTCDLLAVPQERGLCEERQASPLLRQGVYTVYCIIVSSIFEFSLCDINKRSGIVLCLKSVKCNNKTVFINRF